MADFLLTVGIDTKLSFSQMQADITSLASQLSSNPIKIKAEFDKASLASMKSQIDSLTNMTGKTKAVNVGTNVTTNAKGVVADMNNIANSADKATTAINKMNSTGSKTTILSQGTTQYYNSLRQVNTLLEQVTKNQTKWTAAKQGKASGAYNDLSMYADELRNLQLQLQTGQMSAEQFNRSMASIKTGVASASGAIRTAGEATKSWSQRIGGLGSKFATWFGTTQIIMAGVRAVKDMVNNVAEIDSAMIELRKVTDETDETYNAFLDRATKKSQEMGVSIKDTVKATAEFARLGNSISDSEILSDAAIVYKNVGDIDSIEDASQSIISTMQAFGVLPKDVMSIVDKFNEVGNKYAISSEGIGEALLRSSSAMKSAGNTLDETIALTTAANTIIQNPESVGTTLKTVSMYLRAAKTEAEEAGESTDGMAASVSELRKELLALTGGQVDIQSDNNTFKSTYQILKELSEVWGNLTDISQANILEMVGGKRNANVVAALLENFSIAEEALQTSLNSEGSAMKEYEKWLDSVEAKQLQLKAAWEGLSQDFLSSDFVKLAVDALRGLVNALDAVVDAIGGVGVTATGVGLVGLKKFASAKGLDGLLSLLGAIPAPALAVAAGLTAIGVAAYQAKKHSDNLKIGATLAEDTEQIKEHADNIVELNNLMSEVDALELIINTPSSTQEQIDSAKARLEEIAALVNDKYELNIEADTEELKDTLALLSKQQRGEMMDDVDDYIGKLNKTEYKDAKSSYKTDKKRYDELSQIYSDLENLVDKRSIVSETPYSDQQASDLFKIDNEIAEYYKKIEEMGYGDLVRDASSKMYGLDLLDIGTELGEVEKKYNKASTTIKNFEESSQKATDYLAQVLASDVALGDSYGIDTSVAKFEQLGTTLTEVGANTDYMAQKFAISRQGVTDLNSAIEDGKLDSVVEEYLNFKNAIGDTSENAVRGAALLKQGFTEATQVTGESINAVYDDMKKLGESNGVSDYVKNAIEGTSVYAAGFNTLQDVIAAGDEGINKFLNSAKGLYEYEGLFTEDMGLDQKAEELTNFAHQIGLIPEDKSVRIDVDTGEVSVISDFTKKINDIWGSGDKTLNVSVNTEVNGDDIDDYKNKVEALDNKDCNITFNADGSPARAVIGDITYDLKDYDESTGTATLYAEDGGAIGTIDLVNGKIELLPDKKVITFEATYSGTKGITEYASVIDDLKGRGDISFNIDVNGNTEILNEAEEVIARLEKDKNIVFHVDADGNLEVINTLTNDIQVLDKYGNVKFNVYANVENLGAIEGLKGDLAELNGQECYVTLSADNTPVMAKIGETNFAISDYDAKAGTATLRAENGEAIATINLTTGAINAVPDKTANVNANVTGTEDVKNLDNTIENTDSKSVTVSATTSGQSALEKLKSLIDGIKSKVVSVTAKIFGGGGVDGTAHVGGTAFVGGKKGDWGTKHSGVALGGELGQELIVRDGRFFTIGDNGAEFFTYKKDDIIFNAEQTKQIFEKGRITHGKRRGRALATGTAFATGTNNLFSATHTLDASAQVVVRDVSVDATKLDETLEDTLKEMQEGIDGAVGAYEQDIFLAEKHGASSEEIIAIYKKMQQTVNDQANKYREKGLGDDSEYIQKMQKQWWDYQENINEIIADGYDKNREQIENAADLAKIQLEKAVASGDYGAVSTYTSNIIDYYKQMQESVHDQAEYYRSLGYSDTSEEVSELSQLWWDYQENINEIIADGYDALVERAVETVDTIQNVYDTLKSAADEYAETGKLPIDLLKSMSEIGIEYMAYLQDENGMLEINEDKINAVVAARTRQLAVDTALSYVEKLRIALADGNIGKVESLVSATESASTATWELVYANLAMLDLNDEQYKKALANVNKFRSLADSAAMSVFDDSNEERSTMLDNTKDALDTILDLTMELVEYEVNQEIEAIERRIESYQEIIDLKKEALETTKEESDYEDEVADKVKEIADIQARINALSLDDSREAQAERISLEEELSELQGDLADYQADYSIEKQQEMLDEMADDYQKAREDDIADLEDSISSQEKIYELAIKRIKNDWDGLYDDIIAWNYEAGSNIESEIVDAWELATAAVQEYGSWVKAVKAMENIDTEDNTELGESGNYIDPRAIRNQMRANSLAWYTASDAEQRSLENKNNNYANQLGLTSSDGVWYMPDSDDPFYTIGIWEAVDYMVKAMRTNSSNWTEGRTDLEQANEKMAGYIQDLTGQTVKKDGDGVWWIGDDVLYDSYGKFHTGGIIGKSTLKQDEVMAILQKGEAVLDEKREEGLYKIVDFTQVLSERFGKSINTAGLNNLLNSFSLIPATKDLMPITQGGIGAVEFKPNIEVNITHGGSMSESDAKRYGAIAAETTLNELKSAFTKKGITNIGSSALK